MEEIDWEKIIEQISEIRIRAKELRDVVPDENVLLAVKYAEDIKFAADTILRKLREYKTLPFK